VDLARKWPFVADWPGVKPLHLRLGEKVNNTSKLVVTREYAQELKWGEFPAPKPLRGSNVAEQIKKLKQGAGGDIMTFGRRTSPRRRSLVRRGVKPGRSPGRFRASAFWNLDGRARGGHDRQGCEIRQSSMVGSLQLQVESRCLTDVMSRALGQHEAV
jgi:hypothetical protein